MARRFSIILILLAYANLLYSQSSKKNASYQLYIEKTTSAINIDGVLNEEAWEKAEVADSFRMVLPMDTSLANVKTEVRMTYDENNLYLSAVNFHLLPGPAVVESLRRDFVFSNNDNFLVFIDPFDDQTNGFTFGANAVGAQWDGQVYDGSNTDLSWDNKWYSAVKTYDDYWVFEAAIPFKTIRYKKDIKRWGINFSRMDIKTAEKSSWAPMPRQFPTSTLAYAGVLVWDEPPPQAGSNISLIPYALGGFSKNYDPESSPVYRKEVGLDAKVALSSSINLDLTINPDFSQVEVDRQVTNLDRFELFFPERRQFFIENSDLFSNFGYSTIRPFFSRRIGLGVPITFGAKLSGKINRDWRIGAMNVLTKKVNEDLLPAQNFSVFAIRRRVFARSNIGLILINKESINYDPGLDDNGLNYSKFNRNIGLEYNLFSSNNIWTGKFLLLKSFSPENHKNEVVYAGDIKYNSKRWKISGKVEYVGENYTAEVGYVPRFSYIRIGPEISYLFFPKTTHILTHGPRIVSSNYFDLSFNHTDNENYFAYDFMFRDQSTFQAWIAHDDVILQYPFDPTNVNGDTLSIGSSHSWNSWGLAYKSTPENLFTYSFTTREGGYYADGNRLNLTGSIAYRFQPYVNISVDASYNRIKLPQPWGKLNFWLIGPEFDLTLTNKLFFTTFIQYNQQIENINLNTRFQWRFKPASDLFIVYTDNYLPYPFHVKNKALVMKLTYWWNL